MSKPRSVSEVSDVIGDAIADKLYHADDETTNCIGACFLLVMFGFGGAIGALLTAVAMSVLR